MTTFELPASEVARMKRAERDLRVQAARGRRGWLEFDRDRLEARSGFLVTSDGLLLEPVRAPVFITGENGRVATINESEVHGWYLGTDGEPAFLKESTTSGLRTVADLDRRDAEKAAARERAEREQTAAAEKLAAFRSAQKLQPLTVSSLSIREAAGRVLDVGGQLEARDGVLMILTPPKLWPDRADDEAERERLDEAVVVLHTAAEIVLAAVTSSSRKDLLQRLPDARAGVCGGVVR